MFNKYCTFKGLNFNIGNYYLNYYTCLQMITIYAMKQFMSKGEGQKDKEPRWLPDKGNRRVCEPVM